MWIAVCGMVASLGFATKDITIVLIVALFGVMGACLGTVIAASVVEKTKIIRRHAVDNGPTMEIDQSTMDALKKAQKT